MALIITLILLSVVTFMAVTFLTLSRRERGAVTAVTETAGARFAADAALANAEAQIMANVLASTNPFNFGLIVSTNYVNPLGFRPGRSSFTNVNFTHKIFPGGPLGTADFLQSLTNSWYSPRPPVFVVTNPSSPPDFRFYVDLNRNGRFDRNDYDTNYDITGSPMQDASNVIISNRQVGDPEWIGILEKPDAPYGPNNKFIARYAFIAVPVGNALDLNYIHNNAKRSDQSSADDGYYRNQGVGSWEINLAAFLADLNTNQWFQDPFSSLSYYDYEPGFPIAQFRAFDDALALLNYRYGYSFANLARVQNLYPAYQSAFRGSIDEYSDGPLMTTLSGTNDNGQLTSLPWSGADNTNRFYTHQELFDPASTGRGVNPLQTNLGNYFSGHLLAAGSTNSTYDRYTFYRMLSQLGTDSMPDSGKMNVNYNNLDPYTNALAATTNFIPWEPLAFFTNAADRLLRAYTTEWRTGSPTNFAATFYGVSPTNFDGLVAITNPAVYPAFGIGNIPVWVSNRFVYSPAVNRLLQLAANMYDASTENTLVMGKNYPSVFRPLFSRDVDAFGNAGRGTNVYITGFTNVFLVNLSDPSDYQLAMPIDIVNLSTLNTSISFINQPTNVYGVPWIIGAKKGFPNFNELAMETTFQLARKIQVTRTSPSAAANTYKYNQMFLLNLTNRLGVECWNSYTNAYSSISLSPLTIYVTENLENIVLTNDESFGTNMSFTVSRVLPVNAGASANSWPGYTNGIATSFEIPLNESIISITNSVYRFRGPLGPHLDTNLALPYETGVTFGGTNYPQPHWLLMVTNNLRVAMLEPVVGNPFLNRVIDYVQLRGPNSVRDLSAEVATLNIGNLQGYNGLWMTNFLNGFPAGIGNQVAVSLGSYGVNSGNGLGSWNSQDPTTVENEIDGFLAFFHASTIYNHPSGAQDIGNAKTTNALQAPYTPSATCVQHISWQVNDPLVHYTGDDLNWSGAIHLDHSPANLTDDNLGALNQRYMPWGGNPIEQGSDPYPFASSIKDPGTTGSDAWDFPTNRFPTVGWLGRVHRGTPWQMVYLKSFDVLDLIQPLGNVTNLVGEAAWMNWTGNRNPFDATNAAPVHDRLIFDLFTTAVNDNATRGTLSVNVGPTNGNLAAWSAVFSGVVVPTNLFGRYIIINPAGFYDPTLPQGQWPALAQIVMGTNGINQTRATFTNADGLAGTFEHVGDILAVPALTEHSPFLTGLNPVTQVNDELYEWLPQQTLSLLRCTSSPRYVIYCYGQTLKPALNASYSGILGNGAYLTLVTNYQVVSEIATRAVVRFNSTLTNVVRTNIVFNSDNNTYVTNWIVPVVTNNSAVIESFNLLPPD